VLREAIKDVSLGDTFKDRLESKRFALVWLLAPEAEEVSCASALAHAIRRELTYRESRVFAVLQKLWRRTLMGVGEDGVPKYGEVVFVASGELQMSC